MPRLLFLALLLPVAACAKPGTYPSLNPRPIETKAAGLLSEPESQPAPLAPATAAVQSKVDAAVASAQQGARDFGAALPAARAAASAAGASGSESWIAAQMAISALERTRTPVKGALSDLDALLRGALAGPPSEDLARIQDAIRTVEALDAGQNEAMTSLLQAVSR